MVGEKDENNLVIGSHELRNVPSPFLSDTEKTTSIILHKYNKKIDQMG